MGRQMSDVSSKYGAPMGREEHGNDDGEPLTERARCFRLRMVDGDYDDGGAYWGSGGPEGFVYCATNGDGFRYFTRAHSRASAKAKFLERDARIRWIN